MSQEEKDRLKAEQDRLFAEMQPITDPEQRRKKMQDYVNGTPAPSPDAQPKPPHNRWVDAEGKVYHLTVAPGGELANATRIDPPSDARPGTTTTQLQLDPLDGGNQGKYPMSVFHATISTQQETKVGDQTVTTTTVSRLTPREATRKVPADTTGHLGIDGNPDPRVTNLRQKQVVITQQTTLPDGTTLTNTQGINLRVGTNAGSDFWTRTAQDRAGVHTQTEDVHRYDASGTLTKAETIVRVEQHGHWAQRRGDHPNGTAATLKARWADVRSGKDPKTIPAWGPLNWQADLRSPGHRSNVAGGGTSSGDATIQELTKKIPGSQPSPSPAAQPTAAPAPAGPATGINYGGTVTVANANTSRPLKINVTVTKPDGSQETFETGLEGIGAGEGDGDGMIQGTFRRQIDRVDYEFEVTLQEDEGLTTSMKSGRQFRANNVTVTSKEVQPPLADNPAQVGAPGHADKSVPVVTVPPGNYEANQGHNSGQLHLPLTIQRPDGSTFTRMMPVQTRWFSNNGSRDADFTIEDNGIVYEYRVNLQDRENNSSSVNYIAYIGQHSVNA